MNKATDKVEGVTDTTSLEDAKENERLIEEICYLKEQKAALDMCLSDRVDRLQTRMAAEGHRRLKIDVGTASFCVQTVYSVHSKEMLAHMFTKQALVSICKPNRAFVEAAKRVGLDISECITEGVDERFKVERARTKAAREQQKATIEASAAAIEEKIANFVKDMEG